MPGGFKWLEFRGRHFDLFYEADTEAERDLDLISSRLEAASARVQTLLGAPLRVRTQAFVVQSRARMRELVGVEANGFATGRASLMVYNETTDGVGAHEFCHVWARSAWGRSKGVWINEGLAVYADDLWYGYPVDLVAKWLLDRGALVPLADLPVQAGIGDIRIKSRTRSWEAS